MQDAFKKEKEHIVRKATDILLYDCANCKEHERILFAYDKESSHIVKELWTASSHFSQRKKVLIEKEQGQKLSHNVKKAFLASDVIFCITKTSFFHSQARGEATKKGARFINMVDYSMDMLAPGSSLFCNFDELATVCTSLASVMSKSTKAVITSAAGTDISFSLTGKPALPQFGRSIHAGESSSPPNVECAVCAAQGSAEGVIVVDGSIPHPLLGLIDEPLILDIHAGRIVNISCQAKKKYQADVLRNLLKDCADDAVYQLGEIGIGLNPMCEISGQMLEDEGCLGTMHFGVGDNQFFGGSLSSPYHFDFVIRSPSILLDKTYIQTKGKLESLFSTNNNTKPFNTGGTLC